MSRLERPCGKENTYEVAVTRDFHERRQIRDRRQQSWASFLYGGLKGRRREHRRAEDRQVILDWVDPPLLYLILGILLFSTTDAILTLALLTLGAEEANFFMAVLIERDISLFAGIKMSLTCFGTVVLAALGPLRIFRLFKASFFLYFVFVCYAALILYQSILLRG